MVAADRSAAADDDRTLVAAAQAGDRAALDRLLRRHYDRIHGVCRRLSGSAAEADDAAQEAMIAIVRGLPRFDGRAAFTTWAHRIATNATLDELRRRKRRPALHVAAEDGSLPEPTDVLADRRVAGVETRLDLDQALATLPDEFRQAVVLRDLGDLDYAEIAEALDVPVGTVKSRIARGRRLLVAALDPPDAASADDVGAVGNRDGGLRRQSSDRPSPGSEPDTPP